MKSVITIVVALSMMAACDTSRPPESDTPSNPPVSKDPHVSIYQLAVNNDGRTDSDRAKDPGRKPSEVLEFFAIAPGMSVLDMFSGGGYYTELLSHVVGPGGRVTAHTNQAYAQFVGEEATNRYANNRLANIELLNAENNELELTAGTYDAAMMILAYHDIYYVAPNDGWPKINGPRLMKEIYDSIKPGGMLAIVDHYAMAGSPRETGNTLHRIDPQIVIEELNEIGFSLEEKSDVLRNADDDHSLSVGAPEIRGKTDRFVLKFRKPG